MIKCKENLYNSNIFITFAPDFKQIDIFGANGKL
jgi:hypothetical protein